MIEPTETESKETLDAFIADFRDIIATAKSDPEKVLETPVNTAVGRIDETRAARQPDLRWRPPAAGITRLRNSSPRWAGTPWPPGSRRRAPRPPCRGSTR